MNGQNFSRTYSVEQSPEKVFAAINNPRGWWSEAIEGDTDRLGAVFYYHYKGVHRCTLKISERVPDKKVVWRVLHNDFNFTKDKTEWNGTDIVFELARNGDKTELRFTHVGLVPAYECHEVCSDAWSLYVTGSLRELITTGKGRPNPVDMDEPHHNAEITANARESARLQK